MATESYVKFVRGSLDNYKLIEKNEDTLYFVYNEDESSTALYLGTRLIAGTGEIIGASNLDELNDVLISAVAGKDILMYDEESNAWKNITFESLLTQIEENIDIAPSAQVFQSIVDKDADQSVILGEIASTNTLNNGDIAIIKETISDGKYQHTAYVYHNGNWAAMDGNYRADNVYFDEDFTFTKAIGTVTIPASGSVKVDAAGKNLQEFFAALFASETQPKVTAQPSVKTMTMNPSGSYEVGTELTGITYTATFEDGTYSYGPEPTGVQVSSWSVKDSNGVEVGTAASGNVPDYTVAEGDYKVTATATYSAGSVAVTNLGNPSSPEVKIAVGSKSKSSAAITGYRNTFYGGIAEVISDANTAKTILTSDKIRGLAASGATLVAGSEFTSTIEPGLKTAIIAVPAGLGLTSVKYQEGLFAPVLDAYKLYGSPVTVSVEGADGNAAIDYDVYYMALGDGYTVTGHHDVII